VRSLVPCSLGEGLPFMDRVIFSLMMRIRSISASIAATRSSNSLFLRSSSTIQLVAVGNVVNYDALQMLGWAYLVRARRPWKIFESRKEGPP
jgi:hypothetical protein